MILELKNIYKTYEQGKMDVPVLRNISMSIEKGDYVAIMGPSGSGKTTLMNLIGCLDNPSSGEYLLDGENVLLGNDSKLSDVRLNSIGFVFQSFHLLPRQTALENVALPLLYAGIKKKERLEIARYALGRVGLADRTDFKPTQLSGGQCQRVAIARAIVNNPKILLADEPTGALDTVSGEQIMELFESLNREGVTVIMITHEREIAQHARTIFYIRDGRLVDQNGRFIQSDPTPVGSDQYDPRTLPQQSPVMPAVPTENQQPEPAQPESAIKESLPPPAQPETKIQEHSRQAHTAQNVSNNAAAVTQQQRKHTRPSAAKPQVQRSVTDKAVKNTMPAKAAPVMAEASADSKAPPVRKPVPAQESIVTAAKSRSHPIQKESVRNHEPQPVMQSKPPVMEQETERRVPAIQANNDMDERERLLRMDMDALMSRVIGGARQAEPEKPAAAVAAPAPTAEKVRETQKSVARQVPAQKPAAVYQKPVSSPAPVSKPAAVKPEPTPAAKPPRRPAPTTKPAPSGGIWTPHRGNAAPVFAFDTTGQFNSPIKIDLKNTDMGGSPWLFSTRGE